MLPLICRVPRSLTTGPIAPPMPPRIPAGVGMTKWARGWRSGGRDDVVGGGIRRPGGRVTLAGDKPQRYIFRFYYRLSLLARWRLVSGEPFHPHLNPLPSR